MAGHRAYRLGYLGRTDEASAILREFMDYLKRPEGHLSAIVHRYLIEAAVAAGDAEACQEMLIRTEPLAPYLMTEAWMCFCVARHLGDAAALLGLSEKARSFYELAEQQCHNIRFRPELALSRLGLAELLLDHYPQEREAAIEHLDFAIAELRDMKMRPALECALGRRGLLKA